MKKLYAILALLCLTGFFANAQTFIKEDSIASDTIQEGVLEWYRFVTPVNGMLEMVTTASVPDTGSPEEFQFLGLEVLGQNNNIGFGTFYPRVGNGGVPLSDTFYACCMAVDTFYFRFDVSLISKAYWTYSISWRTIPTTYPPSAQPDSFPGSPQVLPYNTKVTGNLGFNDGKRIGENNTNEWLLVPPTDGRLKINVSVEAESLGGDFMSLIIYNSVDDGFAAAQYATAGVFQKPLDTVIYWDCISGGDTFHLEPAITTYGDGGYAYQLSYTMVPPVFNNDVEPNNSFAQAQVVDPKIPIEGHLSFYGESDDDYFKFYKPDTGFLKIFGQIESAVQVSQGAFMYVNLYDSTKNPVKNFYPLIGGNSQPALDTLYIASLAPGFYYLEPIAGLSCTSYRFQVTTPTIWPTSILNISAVIPMNIFPNPSSSVFTIDLGSIKNTTIAIYNTLGQLVEAVAQKNERYVVLSNQLPGGLYYLKASNTNGEIVSQGKLAITR